MVSDELLVAYYAAYCTNGIQYSHATDLLCPYIYYWLLSPVLSMHDWGSRTRPLLPPSRVSQLLASAHMFHKISNYSAAATYFRHVLEYNPGNEDAYESLFKVLNEW